MCPTYMTDEKNERSEAYEHLTPTGAAWRKTYLYHASIPMPTQDLVSYSKVLQKICYEQHECQRKTQPSREAFGQIESFQENTPTTPK
jgi:hypothetical protein